MSISCLCAALAWSYALQALPPYPDLPSKPNVAHVIAIETPQVLLVRDGTRITRVTLGGIDPPATTHAPAAQQLLSLMLVGESIHQSPHGVVLRVVRSRRSRSA